MQVFWEIVASNALTVTVMALGLVLLSRFWRNPVGLHLLWVLILLKLCTPPIVTLHLPVPMARSFSQEESILNESLTYPTRTGVSPEEFAATTVGNRNPQVIDDRPILSSPPTDIESVPLAAQRIGISWTTVLAWIWGVGIAAFTLGYTYRILRFRRLLGTARSPSGSIVSMAAEVASWLGLKQVPEIRMLPLRISPLVWWLCGKPRVLLPAALFERMDDAAQKAILTHELAHIRRKDHWVRWLELVMTTLFWWHPVVWWACRQLQSLEDQCCDAMLVGMTPQSAKTYAVALLDTLDFLSERPVVMPLGVTATRPLVSLSRRIAMLKNPPFLFRLTFGRMVLLAAAAALPMAIAFATEPPNNQNGTDAGKSANSPGTASATARSSKDAQGLTYHGKVVDKLTGKPVEGATVLVRKSISSSTEHRMLEETKHTTDAQGDYSFRLSPEQVAERYMYLEFEVSHPSYAHLGPEGYALSMIRKNEKLGAHPFFERLQIEPGEEISGTLVTPENGPATGVRILAYSKAKKDDFADYGHFAKTTTDAKGEFRLNMVKGGEAVLWLLPDKYAPSTYLFHQQGGNLGRIVLEKGITLQGRVVSAGGEAVAGVWVNAELQGGPAKKTIGMPVYDAMARSAVTDSNGKFTMAPVPPGDYTLIISDNPRASDTQDRTYRPVADTFLHQNLTLKPNESPQTVEIRAVPQVVIEIQQVDGTGKPKKTHAVHFSGRSGDTAFWTEGKPDPKGKIVMKVPKGLDEAEIQVTTNEHGAARFRFKDGMLCNGHSIKLDRLLRKDIRDLTIYYYEAPVLLIKVLSDDGTELRDSRPQLIYQKPFEQSPSQGDVHFEKQEDGRWRSHSLLPDEPFLLIVEADGYKLWGDRLTLPEGAVKELEVRLKRK